MIGGRLIGVVHWGFRGDSVGRVMKGVERCQWYLFADARVSREGKGRGVDGGG